MARWNDDGSCAPTARVRSGKGEPFCLTLTKQEIEDDVNMFDQEARALAASRTPPRVRSTDAPADAAGQQAQEVRFAPTGHYRVLGLCARAACNPPSRLAAPRPRSGLRLLGWKSEQTRLLFGHVIAARLELPRGTVQLRQRTQLIFT